MLNKLKKLFFSFRSIKLLKALRWNIFLTVEHLPLLSTINNLNTIIDIGANKGQFSIAAKYVFPKSRIISFEPLKAPSDKYNKLFKDDEDVIMYKSAIGIYQKKLSMHISKKTDSSSILPIGENQASIFPGTEESHIENITIAPLRKFIKYDDLISPVFVKIDVQGYELEVLKGCKEFLEYFNYIYVECSFIELYKGQAFFDEVYDFLSKYSFKLSGVYNVFYDNKGLAVQGDFLFIKKK